ncbi:uncharacterized protein LOC117580796 [Drosophila guanche]|uniref:Uncharacterized protein n=1 Tax=Drosophila guanche TaxID=7266 RepID=A0A3B0JRI2_DROGU|nr:uncharacterized protein LOC117580796 [Drosophila guanche]XP_034123385.1 uncharacterized protein LOC117580796 [Drosophila guanche]XP_034123386.1 uncharacterized protein LOC117580796 [Drosophila guanche]SPP78070.1 Hypothetical predicted protein [Drosophila guanche]
MPKQQYANDKTKQRLRAKAAGLAGSKSIKSKYKLKRKSRSKGTVTRSRSSKGGRSLGKPLTKLRSSTKAKKRLQKQRPASSMPTKGMKKKRKNAAAAAKNKMLSVKPKETSKKKPTRGTPVLFLVKDPGYRRQSMPCTTQSKGHKTPLQPTSQLPRYVATGSMPTDSRLARLGVDFFHHLGQRNATDPEENSWKPPMRLAAGGWSAGVAMNVDAPNTEVPLTHRLPIIDFISTNEFKRMCAKSRTTGTTSLCSAQQRM